MAIHEHDAKQTFSATTVYYSLWRMNIAEDTDIHQSGKFHKCSVSKKDERS
jgi:hypothetical protein